MPVVQWPLREIDFTWYWAVPGGAVARRISEVSEDTYKAHSGLDFRAVVGTDVLAVADGVVAYVGYEEGGYGNYIRTRHGPAGAQWDAMYCHLRTKPPLAVGAVVRMGQVIGLSGNTGNSTGAHLHLEIRLVRPDGSWDVGAPGTCGNACVDPITFFVGMERGILSETEKPPAPLEVSDSFLRCLAFVLKWEGGWSENPSDPGGPTMKGVTLATYTRWCVAQRKPTPDKEALRRITDDEVQQIYMGDYWLAAGCDKLAWPLQLAHFDAAVNSGPGQAAKFLEKAGGDFAEYMGLRIAWYTEIANWETFGRGWVRRCADLLREGG